MNDSSAASLINIRLVDLDKVSDAQLTPFLDWLNAGELARYARFGRQLRQRQFLAGRILLRWSLMQLSAVPRHAITLTEQVQNAPLLHMAGLDRVPAFSVSHTGNWVACACSHAGRLGLDIELLNAKRDLQAIARHSFEPPDLDWMQQQMDPVQAFYFLWSRKEAHYKLTQSHVSNGMEHCYALPHSDVSMVLMTDSALAATPEWSELNWQDIS